MYKKPLIAILLATYNPRMDWLQQQLESLNSQTYPNLRLYVRDDGSSDILFTEIQQLVERNITSFPYAVMRNQKNLGSNLTFELLTQEAEGEFFAYCDQDDIWFPEKLNILQAIAQKTGAGLVCSDVVPVDAAGKPIGTSIRSIRPRHIFREGSGLTSVLIYNNFVIGCTMLIQSEVAKEAVPFAKSMVHDHFLAFSCAVSHSIKIYPGPLIYYRQHDKNQTGVLAHITTKSDYIESHLLPFCYRVDELSKRYPGSVPEEAIKWAEARRGIAEKRPGAVKKALSFWKVNPATSMFELFALCLPDPVFHLVVRVIQGKMR